MMKLLPFPWVFCTRKRARKLIEHAEYQRDLIDMMMDRIDVLQRQNADLRSRAQAAHWDGPVVKTRRGNIFLERGNDDLPAV